MRRAFTILIIAALLPLAQPIWGIGDRLWSQEEQKRARIENALAEYRAAQNQLRAQIEHALKAGDEQQVAEAKAKLQKIDAEIHELEARFAHLNERRVSEPAHGEHPEIAAARDQLKHLRAAHGHLKEGGFHDMAEMVGRRAEEIQAAVERHEHERIARETDRREAEHAMNPDQIGAVLREFNGALRQLREDVKQLREEINELRRLRESERDR